VDALTTKANAVEDAVFYLPTSPHISPHPTKANAVEDAVFADFSKSLNLSSVREYEQRQLVEEQQKEGRVLELQARCGEMWGDVGR